MLPVNIVTKKLVSTRLFANDYVSTSNNVVGKVKLFAILFSMSFQL